MSDSQRARVRTARGFYIAQTDKRADLLSSTIRPTCAILAEFAFHESDEDACSRHLKPEVPPNRRLFRKLLARSLYRDLWPARVNEDTSVARSSLPEPPDPMRSGLRPTI